MIHNRLQQSLKRIIITRVLALADQSKIGCITQPRFAKAGTETPPQRGAALDRTGLSVSTETACRFEPKSPAGNSEICTMGARRQTVEHPFGTLKAWMGATHVLTKRLPRVSTEMSLHVLAYNLKRVMRIVGIVPLMQAMRA